MKGKFQNTLYTNDNLFILNGMNSDLVDLIYLDPPFNSKRTYSAPIGSKAAGASFKDMWTWRDVDVECLEGMIDYYPDMIQFIESVGEIHGKPMKSYITYMTQRIIQLHRILKPTGSFYMHCDPTASHYLKIMIDRIFGKDNFINEIIWHYGKWTNAATHFQKNHDVILLYARNRGKHTFNKLYDDASEERQHYQRGYHTNVIDGITQLLVYDRKKAKARIEKGGYDVIVYREQQKSVALPDVWNIPIINPQAKERTGYPTQKPLALLRRVIAASSNKKDIILDPFCGCGTSCVAAAELERQYIGIDIEKQAAGAFVSRLKSAIDLVNGEDRFIYRTDIPQRTDIKQEKPSPSVKKRLYKKQKGKCNGCRSEYQIKDFAIDHIIPRAKGGGDYYANYQLLCGNCNSIKGSRTMDYLRMRIKERKLLLNPVSFGA